MIRPATEWDFDALIEMGRAFNEEAGYSEDVPFHPASFLRTLKLLTEAKLLLVADKDGDVVGMAAADVAPSICNRSILVGREAFWYVLPEHRKGLGGQILDALEFNARAYGATLFDVVAEEGKRNDALARLYRARGYSPAEHTFRKVL